MKKMFLAAWLGFGFSAWAASPGVQMNFNILKDGKLIGTVHYLFHDGNLRAKMDFKDKSMPVQMGEVTHIYNKTQDKTYTVFHKDKSYMENPDFKGSSALWAKHGKKKKTPKYVDTGKTKRISGYSCKVMVEKGKKSQNTICASEKLYQEYKGLAGSMKRVGEEKNALPASLKAFPIETIMKEKGQSMTFVATNIQKVQKANEKQFLPPAGHAKKATMDMSPDGILKNMQNSNMSEAEMKKQIEAMKRMAEEMKKKYGQ